MKKNQNQRPQAETQYFSPDTKKPWQEPKLAFVEPKLTKHGDLKELTGFFGGFSPGLEE